MYTTNGFDPDRLRNAMRKIGTRMGTMIPGMKLALGRL